MGSALARAGSAALGAATCVLLALAAHAFTGSLRLAVAAGLAAALHPQLAFVGSYVNGDAATAAAGALLTWSLARWAAHGESDAGLPLIGVAAGAVLLGKPNGYALLLPAAAWVLWAYGSSRVSGRALVRAGALTLALAGPFLLANGFRNGGDALGTRTFRAFLLEHPELKDGRALDDPWPGFLEWFAKSSFGVFGNMNVTLPAAIYRGAAILVAGGATLALGCLRGASGASRRGAAWLAASLAINALLAYHMSWYVNFQPQGRYALLPLVLLSLVAVGGPALGKPSGARMLWTILAVTFFWVSAALATGLLLARPCGG